jgi:hypothetical protein
MNNAPSVSLRRRIPYGADRVSIMIGALPGVVGLDGQDYRQASAQAIAIMRE